MRCFYLPAVAYREGEQLSLPKELSRHVEKVLRLAAGETVLLFDGNGLTAQAQLLGQGRVLLQTISQVPEPVCPITLIQGLPKGEKLELILQKGTELGVHRFVLLPLERSVGRVRADKLEDRLQRWRKIVQEAARQCRQFHLPQVEYQPSLTQALATVTADEKLFFWEEAARPLAVESGAEKPQGIALIVGPEGGMTPAEADLATAAGYRTVRLGPRILRTETAGLAAVSVLQYLYGDLATAG